MAKLLAWTTGTDAFFQLRGTVDRAALASGTTIDASGPALMR
jgi:hypothetical protein